MNPRKWNPWNTYDAKVLQIDNTLNMYHSQTCPNDTLPNIKLNPKIYDRIQARILQ